MPQRLARWFAAAAGLSTCALASGIAHPMSNHLDWAGVSIQARQDSSSSGMSDAKVQRQSGQGIVGFATALGVAVAVFAVQLLLFILLRNKLARI